MGRPKRQYPLGKYRLRAGKHPDKSKPCTVVLEYTWNRQIFRKTTNILVWKNRSRLGQCAGADWDTFDGANLMIFSETVAF